MYFIRIFIKSAKGVFHTDHLIHTLKLSGQQQTADYIGFRIYMHAMAHAFKNVFNGHEIKRRKFYFFFPFIHLIKEFKIFGHHIAVDHGIRALVGPQNPPSVRTCSVRIELIPQFDVAFSRKYHIFHCCINFRNKICLFPAKDRQQRFFVCLHDTFSLSVFF